MYKVYTSGNYFFINTPSGEIYEALSKDILVRKRPNNKFYFSNLKGWNEDSPLSVSQMVNENDVPYTLESFTSFYQTETGKYSAGAAALPTGWASYIDTEYTLENPFSSTAGVPFVVPNNAGEIRNSQKPQHIDTFYDPAAKTIPGLNGDGRSYMFYWKAKPASQNAGISLWLDIGTNQDPIELYGEDKFFRGTEFKGVLYSLPVVYNLDTWQRNGAKLWAVTSVNMQHYGMTFNFKSTHKA